MIWPTRRLLVISNPKPNQSQAAALPLELQHADWEPLAPRDQASGWEGLGATCVSLFLSSIGLPLPLLSRLLPPL